MGKYDRRDRERSREKYLDKEKKKSRDRDYADFKYPKNKRNPKYGRYGVLK